jgi:Domain of unknown function (DUF4124)
MPVWRIAVWLSVLWVGFAWGQIYKWTDRQGNTHFTDNPSHIPPEYRPKVEVERATPPAPLPAPGDDAAKVPPTDATAPSKLPSAAPPKDRLGRGPDYWQQLAQYWVDRLQQHIEERDKLRLMYDYTRTLASSTRDVFDRGRVEAEIARLEKAMADVGAQITKAETMLSTTLPSEAKRMGANPDWLKPPGVTQQ